MASQPHSPASTGCGSSTTRPTVCTSSRQQSCILESRDSVGTLGGGSIRGSMRVEVLVSTADARQATETLGAFLEPTGAQSIEAAANTDPTWRGTVDDTRLISVNNIGRRKLNGASCIGADFHFWFVKSG